MAKIIVNNPRQVINGGAKKYYFKVKGLGGPKGDKGDKGDTGQTGPQGPQGDPCTVVVNSTATLEPGSSAYVTNTGSLSNAVLNFGIPQGLQGPQGAKGDKGDTGAQGETGPRGPQGDRGTNATVTVGTTTTTEPGTQAYAWNSSSNPNNAVINFNIPRGATGAQGPQGPQGPAGPQGQCCEPTIVNSLPSTGEEGKLYLTPKNYTTGTATGNPITISLGEDAGQITSFKLDGDTFQQTYTGKNLCGGTLAQLKNSNPGGTWDGNQCTKAGITWTVYENADGTIDRIEASGKATRNGQTFYIKTFGRQQFEEQLGSEKTYTLSGCPQGGDSGYYVRVASDPWKVMLTDRGSAATGTLVPSDGYNDVFVVLCVDIPAGQVNNLVFRPQLELGSTATAYEPYVGGSPSPNPDYPQSVQTVTGEQTVMVVGKNLISANWESGRYNDLTGAKEPYSDLVRTDAPIAVQPNTTYICSRNGSGLAMNILQYKADGSFINATTIRTDNSFTTGADTYFVTMYRGTSGGTDGIQLELGSTITSYAPYHATSYPISLGSIELCKLGTYQDYIYEDGNDWKVHKEIGEVTLDGSETWAKASANSGYRFWTGKAADIKVSTDAVLKANRLGVAQGDTWDNYGISGSYTPTRIYIRDVLFNDMTVDQLRSWLATHNIIAYYALATPTDTAITDTNLIAQLEAIRTASLQASNTITNTATGSNLAGDMEISYYGYNPTNRYDKWLWLDLNNNYEQIGS